MITKNTVDKQPPVRRFFFFVTDILIPLAQYQHMKMLEEGSINDFEQKVCFLRSLQVLL